MAKVIREEPSTVVVDRERRGGLGTIIAVVLIVLVLLFLFGVL